MYIPAQKMFRLCLSVAAVCLVAGDALYFQPQKPKGVYCPDQSQCPDGTTCCPMPGGGYGCCPSGMHCCFADILCCPNGYKCDIRTGMCDAPMEIKRAYPKKPAQAPPARSQFIICGGGQYKCPNGNTCCPQPGGEFACCPILQATCCKDNTHCCPRGYSCDSSHGTCVKTGSANVLLGKLQEAPVSSGSATTAPKVPAKKTDTNANIICPDKSTCPSDATCCSLADHSYGCCPIQKAVCCSDHTHCCPEGETCDVAAAKCVAKSGVFTSKLHRKFPSTRPETAAEDVTCPGKKMSCPKDSTCCLAGQSIYACCPLPNAVCCADRTHCCPQGYTCQLGGMCTKGNLAITWMLNKPSHPKVSENAVQTDIVVCPDKTSMCQTGSTCCKLDSGVYACCPIQNAVCCADHIHCCPQGYTCQGDKCTKGKLSIPLMLNTRSHPKLREYAITADLIVCPDTSTCQTGSTCCLLDSGEYGCCPMKNAVCCPDRLHCCPDGTKCNTGMCTSTSSSFSVSHTAVIPRRKVDLALAMRRPETIVKCTDSTECPDGNTCCVNSAGKYACCPHAEAECCPDKLHCCPKGYTCGASENECKKGSTTVSANFIARILAKKAPKKAAVVKYVQCLDSETTCPKDNTCCALGDGGYGCCDMPNAVCCASGSCCPAGHKCDDKGQHCIVSQPWATKTSSKRAVPRKERSFLRRAAKGGHILY